MKYLMLQDTATYTGDAIVTSIETSVGVEDMITISLSFTGDRRFGYFSVKEKGQDYG